MNYTIILILLCIFICCHYNVQESYIVLPINKEIPSDMRKYQKKNTTKNHGFIPRSLYPDIVSFNDNYSKKIIKEFHRNNGKQIFNVAEYKNGCKYFYIIKDGKVLSDKFPYLLKKLKNIKNLKNAVFSCLDSNESTTIHNQFDSDLYRVHIPIQIPKNNCGICVENQCRTWKYGSFLLIDENLMHKVWNNSNSDRIVLLLDVKKVKFN